MPSLNSTKTFQSLKLPKGFKFACLNINGLLTHIDQLRVLMMEHKFDVMAINETKLNATTADGLVHIQDYVLERSDRHFNGGGGVALYIKNNINYVIRNDLMPEDLEMMTIEILKPNAKSFLVATWYRPPDAPVDTFKDFEKFLKIVDTEDREVMLAGDINCDLAKGSKDPLTPQYNFFTTPISFHN